MSQGHSQPLHFGLLEDVMSLPTAEQEAILHNCYIVRIGPLVEYTYHYFDTISTALALWADNLVASTLAKVISIPTLTQIRAPLTFSPYKFEFFKIPQTDAEIEDVKWEAFLKRVDNAARQAGLDEGFAQTLAATLGEMVDNAKLHSEREFSGIVGYQRRNNEFEYVVADAGIGVLSSLRRNKDYHWLMDSSQALETAIKNGETRFGKGSGHGTGFNLLLNIAKRDSYLRFRSGDYSLTLDGISAQKYGYIENVIRPCTPLKGFIISVICKAPQTQNFSA